MPVMSCSHASRTRQNLANRAGASNLQSASGAKAERAQAPYLTIYSAFPHEGRSAPYIAAFPYEGRSAPYIANVHTCTLGSRGWQRERAASKVDVRGRKRKQHLAPSIAALSVFTCHYQGVSHAAWPEDKYQSASEETIRWPLAAATIECAAPRLTGLSQREKEL